MMVEEISTSEIAAKAAVLIRWHAAGNIRAPPQAAMETAMPEQNAIEPPKAPSRQSLRGLD